MKNGKIFLGILIGAGAFMLMSLASNNLQQEEPKVEVPRYHMQDSQTGTLVYDAVTGEYIYFFTPKKYIAGNIANRMEEKRHPLSK